MGVPSNSTSGAQNAVFVKKSLQHLAPVEFDEVPPRPSDYVLEIRAPPSIPPSPLDSGCSVALRRPPLSA